MSAGPREQTTDPLRDKIAQVLSEHMLFEYDWGVDGDCTCGFRTPKSYDFAAHSGHVADAVVTLLNEEWGFGDPDENEPESWFSGDQQWPDPEAQAVQAANGRALFRRWVSGWSVVGGEPSE